MTPTPVTPQAVAEKSMRVALEDMTCMITADGMRSATADIIAAAPAVLAELSRLRSAIRDQAERWRNYQPGGFYPEASAYANAIENCGDALIDLLDELAASPVGTGNPS